MHFPTKLLLIVASLAICVAPARADDTITPAQRDFFEKKIRPVLVKHCYECHSADSDELGGKLRLDSREHMRAGGEAGPSIVAGKPDDSVLIQALRYDGLEMPPEEPLSEAVINDFVRWISDGAADPRVPQTETNATANEEATKNDSPLPWSFHPRTDPPLPEVSQSDWPRDSLDRFVLADMEQAKLEPTHDALPTTLIRRLHYDLIGLPPSHDEVTAFQTDYEEYGQQAVAKLVDRLLASPHFGERWGRHWLDVARYGESNGDDGLSRNASFPHAWRYRDYVIDALNNDTPYDRFVTEQIAGDLLPADSAIERNRLLTATGFLAIGPKPAAAMNKNFAMDIVDDQINVVSTAIMGLSVACARCHDHKHDPIPTRDYYALAGIFTSTETLYGTAANEKLTAPPTELHRLESDYKPGKKIDRKATPKLADEYRAEVASLKPAIHASLDEKPEGLTVNAVKEFSPANYATVKESTLRGELSSAGDSYSVAFWFKNDLKNNARPITTYLFSRAAWGDKALPGDHLGIGGSHDAARTGKLFVFNGNDKKVSVGGETVIAPGTWNHVVLIRSGSRVKAFLNGGPDPEIDAELEPTFGESLDFSLGTRSDRFAPLTGNLAEFALWERSLTDDEARAMHTASGQPRGSQSLGLAMGVRERAKLTDCKIHVKGESGKLGPVVPRGSFEVLKATFDESLAVDAKRSGRLELAEWLTREDHPLTARVAVNRVWLHLFGQGIVTTPDDFGIYGSRPTHPALLDHLANRFVTEGWSLKQLIRSIVLSRTYQLDSRAEPEVIAADPNNRLLARHLRRRLDAESIRDSMLLASGRLDPKPAKGSDVAKIDILINWPAGEATELHRPSNHRSVYLCMLRHAPPKELAAFDLPDGMMVAGQRSVTTLPAHGLFLLNSPLVVEQAGALAVSIIENEDLNDDARVRELYARVLQRSPSDTEVNRALHHVEAIAAKLAAEEADTKEVRHKAWASVSQALLASNEFRYVD